VVSHDPQLVTDLSKGCPVTAGPAATLAQKSNRVRRPVARSPSRPRGASIWLAAGPAKPVGANPDETLCRS
jgi:hypothetical protein